MTPSEYRLQHGRRTRDPAATATGAGLLVATPRPGGRRCGPPRWRHRRGAPHRHPLRTGATTTAAVDHHPPPPPTRPADRPAAAPRPQLHAPAVVVKIDNVDAARPQTGLNQADVVYEEMVEGGLTRLAAVFQSQYPDRGRAGPLRAGSPTRGSPTTSTIRSSPTPGPTPSFFPSCSQPVTDVDDDNRPDCSTGPTAPPPQPVRQRGRPWPRLRPRTPRPRPSSAFLPAGATFSGPGSAPAATRHQLPGRAVTWDWTTLSGLWLREPERHGRRRPDRRAADATNVIVQFIPYITSGDGDRRGRSAGPDSRGQLVGRGRPGTSATGEIVKGTWSRAP